MISAKQAKKETEEYEKKRSNVYLKQKILEANRKKEKFILLPFKLPIVEQLIERAIQGGFNSCKIHNEITPEVEECLLENGYKVTYYKTFIKVSW